MPLGANQGFSSFPGTYASDQIVYTSANSALKYSNVLNGQNTRGTTGGAVLGIDGSALQIPYHLFNTKFNFPFLGQRDLYNDNKPQLSQSTVNGVTYGISTGTFATMTKNKYIVLTLNSGQVAGITTGTLANITLFSSSYQRVGQDLSNAYRNTWVKRTSGGWYYQTGQPVNAQYSRDKFNTDTEGTGAKPGRLTFDATGNSSLVAAQNYASRYGS